MADTHNISNLSSRQSSSAHTPGPWHRNIPLASKYVTIFAGRNTHVCCLTPTGLKDEEIEGNAHLIAAAPELLEAAQLAANILFLLGPEVEKLGLNAKNVPAILGRAIAKAEGK